MSLSGSLRTLSLAEIFQTLNRSQATGVLRLSAPFGGRDVVFDGGEVIQVVHRNSTYEHSLMERLSALGLVSSQAALQPAGTGSGGYSAVDALLHQGELQEESLREAMEGLMCDEIYDLFTWKNANFIFKEAGPNDEEASTLVTEARQRPIRSTMGHLLMEAARRSDELAEIAEHLPDLDTVPVIVEGREAELDSRCGQYPERPVATLISGHHSFEDIYRLAPVPRTDAQFVIYNLIAEGLIKVLTPDEMIRIGYTHLEAGRYAYGAQLFRRVLAMDANRQDAMSYLAHCLDQLGNSPDASGCYGQLALSYLDEGRGDEAIGMARRAAALSPTASQALVLVRCLLDAGSTDEAIAELRKICARQVNEGQLDEARSTCQKILDLKSDDEEAKRELARIFQMGGVDDKDEEIVVCVQCGETNSRQDDTCGSCGAALHMTCLSCGRVIAASDSICIFCGANPHESVGGHEDMIAPGTEAILASSAKVPDSSKIDSDDWRNDLKAKVKTARDLEERARFQEALTIWKEISRDQYGNAELDNHVRELEALIHDREVERFIERGHKFRDRRRFFNARRAYTAALRCMASDDPRSDRLQELIEASTRSHRLSLIAYGAALLCLAISSWLVIEPKLLLEDFVAEVDEKIIEVQGIAGGSNTQAYVSVAGLPAELQARCEDLGLSEEPEAIDRLKQIEGQVQVARINLGRMVFEEAQRMLEEDDWQGAEVEVERLQQTFGADIFRRSVEELIAGIERARKQDQDTAVAREEAPKILAQGKQFQDAGDLNEALRVFSSLIGHVNESVAKEAKDLADSLRRKRSDYQTKRDLARANMATDLPTALETWKKIGDQAQQWGEGAEWQRQLTSMQTTVKQAQTEYARIESTASISVEDLRAFLKKFPATPESVKVQKRLDSMLSSQAARADEIKRGLATYRQAREKGRVQEAWDTGQNLLSRFPREIAGENIELPTEFLTMPGVELKLDGQAVGVADAKGRLVWWHAPGVDGELVFSKPGNDDRRMRGSAVLDRLQHTILLQRGVAWSAPAGGPVRSMRFGAEQQLLVEAGRRLLALSQDGEVVWQTDLGRVDAMEADAGRSPGSMTSLLEDGRLVVPTNTGKIQLLDSKGEVEAELSIEAQILDVPAVYTNEVVGRLFMTVVASGQLFHSGLDDGDLQAQPATKDLQSGPHIVQTGLDTLALVAEFDGDLIAYSTADMSIAWKGRLANAFSIGPLQRLGNTGFLTTVDDGRLLRFEVEETGVKQRWSRTLPGGLVLKPRLIGDQIYYVTKSEARVLNIDNRVLHTVNLPKGALTGCVAADDRFVAFGITDTDGSHHVIYREGDQVVWTRKLDSKPLAALMADKLVVIGLEDGTVISLPR